MNQISLDLKKLKDKDGNTYYGCFPTIPATIKLDECVFFIFVAEDGEETLVIRKADKPHAPNGTRLE